MLKHLPTSFFVYVIITSFSVGAGYTDQLWNTSEDREYYDCGDWSGVDNSKNTAFGPHWYTYRKSQNNWNHIYTPTNWGYPADAKLKNTRISDVVWTCVHIHGFSKTLHIDGLVYTDNPTNVNYKTSYLRYNDEETLYWHISNVCNHVSVSVASNVTTVKNRVTYYVSHNNVGRDDYDHKTFTVSDTIAYTQWPTINTTITATVENHHTYYILQVPTPDDVVGIKITANNGTVVYEKYSHCLKSNITKSGYQYYDLVECDYHFFYGIFPYGADKYLIDDENNSDISVTLFTPFETHNATIEYTIIECVTDEKIHLKNHSIYSLAVFLLPVVLAIWLYRRL